MDVDVKYVHVGEAIDRRRNELGLSKSEFARRIGVPQQHVNRILERETMETKRLVRVCEVLLLLAVLSGSASNFRIPCGSSIGRKCP